MRLTIVGCSGSFAGPASPASSYLVRAEHDGRDYNLLLDLGSGALGALQRHLDPRTSMPCSSPICTRTTASTSSGST